MRGSPLRTRTLSRRSFLRRPDCTSRRSASTSASWPISRAQSSTASSNRSISATRAWTPRSGRSLQPSGSPARRRRLTASWSRSRGSTRRTTRGSSATRTRRTCSRSRSSCSTRTRTRTKSAIR
eukprot:Amastigsp_a339527_9.p3 type:complete len:124 gc:universal Amastigsp_a339527_9:1125-754(-)